MGWGTCSPDTAIFSHLQRFFNIRTNHCFSTKSVPFMTFGPITMRGDTSDAFVKLLNPWNQSGFKVNKLLLLGSQTVL